MPTDTQTAADVGGSTQAANINGLPVQTLAMVLLAVWAVVLVSRRFLPKPIKRLTDDQVQRIEESLQTTQALEKRLREIEIERAEVIKQARVEALEIRKQAEADAVIRKQEMLDMARQEVEKVIQSGKLLLEQERTAMLIAVRRDLVDIAVKASAKIVTDGLTVQRSQSLAEEMVRKLT
ncbi:MAG: ATP synthase F0 subunit B [Patescibacteria group bacterium]